MLRPRLVFIVGFSVAGCFAPEADPLPGGSETGECPVGAETCACTDAGTCDPGLECRSGLCVAEADPLETSESADTSSGVETSESADTSSGVETSESADTSSGVDTSSSGGADTSSSGGDPCGGLCADDQECVEGECVTGCAAGEIVCDGVCIDPLTDMVHCGASGDCLGDAAGTACDPTPTSPCPGALGDACQAGACVPACPSMVESLELSGAIEELVLPACVTEIHVVAIGAQGGTSLSGSAGGLGARVEGDLCVPPGTTLSILVGEQGEAATYPCGGGGGSTVANGMTPLFVAGGGGGGYYDWAPGGSATVLSVAGPGVGGTSHNDGGGGGGFSTNGIGTLGSGGISFLGGGTGGVEYPLGNPNIGHGGFGGGGGSSESGTFNAGGGGGYNGGNAGNGNASTGGSSWIDPLATNQVFTPATNVGHGSVEISW